MQGKATRCTICRDDEINRPAPEANVIVPRTRTDRVALEGYDEWLEVVERCWVDGTRTNAVYESLKSIRGRLGLQAGDFRRAIRTLSLPEVTDSLRLSDQTQKALRDAHHAGADTCEQLADQFGLPLYVVDFVIETTNQREKHRFVRIDDEPEEAGVRDYEFRARWLAEMRQMYLEEAEQQLAPEQRKPTSTKLVAPQGRRRLSKQSDKQVVKQG